MERSIFKIEKSDEQKIIEWYKKGFGIRRLAILFNCRPSAIKKILIEKNVIFEHGDYKTIQDFLMDDACKKEFREYIQKELNSGFSLTDLATDYDIKSNVLKALMS